MRLSFSGIKHRKGAEDSPEYTACYTRGYFTEAEETAAWAVIERVAQELSLPSPSTRHRSGYGSGWFLEFPRLVAFHLRRSEEAAVEYARAAFTRGEIEIPSA